MINGPLITKFAYKIMKQNMDKYKILYKYKEIKNKETMSTLEFLLFKVWFIQEYGQVIKMQNLRSHQDLWSKNLYFNNIPK